jgi:hypothetical protein
LALLSLLVALTEAPPVCASKVVFPWTIVRIEPVQFDLLSAFQGSLPYMEEEPYACYTIAYVQLGISVGQVTMEEIMAGLKTEGSVLLYNGHGDTGIIWGESFDSWDEANDEREDLLQFMQDLDPDDLRITEPDEPVNGNHYLGLASSWCSNEPASRDLAVIATCLGATAGTFKAGCRLGPSEICGDGVMAQDWSKIVATMRVDATKTISLANQSLWPPSIYTIAGDGDLQLFDHVEGYNCNERRWGWIKALYFPQFHGLQAPVMALSNEGNTLVWERPDLDDEAPYHVFRWEDSADPDDAELVSSVSPDDSVYVDETVSPGVEYHYRVATEDGETMVDLGTASAGLKLLGEFPVSESAGGNALAVRGDNLFVSTIDEIVRFDISDPHSPVETGRRVMDEPVGYLELSKNGEKLYGTTTTDFFILNATGGSGLPWVGAIYDMVSGDSNSHDEIYDLVVDWPIVYVSCGKKGVIAIDVGYLPSQPQAAGTYDPDGGQNAFAAGPLEMVDGELYVWAHNHPSEDFRWDRLDITRTLLAPYWDVAFSLICASNDVNCWDLAAQKPTVAKGQGKGLLALGYGDKLGTVRLEVSGELRFESEIELPYEPPTPYDPDSTANIYSWDVDSRFLYATTQISGDQFQRHVLAFAPWDDEPRARFVTGDLSGADLSAGTVRSQGRYVYYATSRIGDTVLRVYEKPHGCEPDPDQPVRVFPTRDAYKQGENIVLAWMVGCPISATVEVMEDGSAFQTIASETYAVADDIAYFTRWDVGGLSSDFENHTYQVRVQATYESAPSNTYYSPAFRIEVGNTHEVALDGSKDFTSIQAAITAAASGDSIIVYAGNYNEHLTLRSNIRILGKPGASVAPNSIGPAVIANGLLHPPVLSGLEFRFGGGINETALDVDNCGIRVSNCKFIALERAVEISNGFGEFTSCEFVDNHDPSVGGAVWISSAATGQTNFTDCRFEGNSAGSYAGAVWISSEESYQATSPQIQFVNCTFEDNDAPSFSTVRVGQNTRPGFDHCVFVSNHVGAASAIVGGVGGASAMLTNCTFSANGGTGAHDLVSIEPFVSGPPVTATACLFASNLSASALSSAYGASYVVSSSDFYGNGSGDAGWASSGENNFSANPAFCPGAYSIYAFSPCVQGITVPTLVGALDVGCVPAATVTVAPGGVVRTCPAGDGDMNFTVDVNFDDAVMTRTVGAAELRLDVLDFVATVFDADGVLPAGGAASAPNYTTSIAHKSFGGRWLTSPTYHHECSNSDAVAVLLNGHPLANPAMVTIHSPDLNGSGNVDLLDFGIFAQGGFATPAPPGDCRDFTGDGNVDMADFGAYGSHNQHVSAHGPVNAPPQTAVSNAGVALTFTDEFPTATTHQLVVDVEVEGFGEVTTSVFALAARSVRLTFVEFRVEENSLGTVMFAPVARDGEEQLYFGALVSDAFTGSESHLGELVFNVTGLEPYELAEDQFVLTAGDVLIEGAGGEPVMAQMAGLFGRTVDPAIVRVYHDRLEQNFPNPFNPTTTLAFSMKRAENVTLTIYDVGGRRVRQLVNERRDRGAYKVVWDGQNDAGQTVASGVYFYKLVAGSFTDSKKMTILK